MSRYDISIAKGYIIKYYRKHQKEEIDFDSEIFRDLKDIVLLNDFEKGIIIKADIINAELIVEKGGEVVDGKEYNNLGAMIDRTLKNMNPEKLMRLFNGCS